MEASALITYSGCELDGMGSPTRHCNWIVLAIVGDTMGMFVHGLDGYGRLDDDGTWAANGDFEYGLQAANGGDIAAENSTTSSDSTSELIYVPVRVRRVGRVRNRRRTLTHAQLRRARQIAIAGP